MRVVIAGSRDVHYYNKDGTGVYAYEYIERALKLFQIIPTAIISGECKGMDKIGEQWANDNDIEIIRYPAKWDLHGRAAGPIRNAQMMRDADFLIACGYHDSAGTNNIMAQAGLMGKRYAYLKLLRGMNY